MSDSFKHLKDWVTMEVNHYSKCSLGTRSIVLQLLEDVQNDIDQYNKIVDQAKELCKTLEPKAFKISIQPESRSGQD